MPLGQANDNSEPYVVTLFFDNKFSWLTQKDLSYKFFVEEEEEEEEGA